MVMCQYHKYLSDDIQINWKKAGKPYISVNFNPGNNKLMVQPGERNEANVLDIFTFHVLCDQNLDFMVNPASNLHGNTENTHGKEDTTVSHPLVVTIPPLSHQNTPAPRIMVSV